MRVSRVHRLLRLVNILQSGRSYSADDLADTIGVSRRTFFRDLNMLELAGVPYYYEPASKTYAIHREYFLPPVNFTLKESLAFLLVMRKFMQPNLSPEYDAISSAAFKVESILPPEVRDYCGSVLEGVEIRMPPLSDATGLADVIEALRTAVADRLVVRILYDSLFAKEKGRIETLLHPYRLLFINRGWYVVGFSEMHGESRTFKLGRIVTLQNTDERFEMPSAFNLDDYLGNAWQMIKGDKRYHVRIRFLPMVADNVDEVMWHKTQKTTFQEDGSMRFEVDVDGIQEIAWWVMGYGDQAIVEEPQELRDMISKRAQGVVAHYAADGVKIEDEPTCAESSSASKKRP